MLAIHDMISEEAAIGLAILICLWVLGGNLFGVFAMRASTRGSDGIGLGVWALLMGIPNLVPVWLIVQPMVLNWRDMVSRMMTDPNGLWPWLLVLVILMVLLDPAVLGILAISLGSGRDDRQER